jgi:predicted transposase YbfD/YdcC
MSKNFLDHIKSVDDHRIGGMITYPLDEILFCVLVGLLCRGEDFDEIEDICNELLPWLQRFLPFRGGVAPAQTQRRVLQGLKPAALEGALISWVKNLQDHVTGIVAIDGKTVRGSKWDKSGQGALHLVSAYADECGLVLAQCAVWDKSNEITAIPELLKLLEIQGAIVTIDAMGTQTAIAGAIVTKGADYVLAVKGNQKALLADIEDYFADPDLCEANDRACQTGSGHGRIEERTCMAADAGWLAERHPGWRGLRSIATVTATRVNKKTNNTSSETRLYITSLAPDAAAILAASRSHWGVENNLHWHLDVTFKEDESRIRKDHSPRNLAAMRKVVLNLLRQEPTKMSLKRKRLKAAMSETYRETLITVNDS